MSTSDQAGYGVSRDAQVSMQYDANKKSGVVAYLLWFFVGMFGGHRFYLGSTGPAIAQLVITLVSIVTTFLIIGFVGLVVPHLLRIVLGPGHRALLPASALGGALLLVSADLAARTLVPYADLPLGMLTALVGGPFFFWLLRRTRRTAGGWA